MRLLRIYTIYQRPDDFPTANYVVRGFTVTAAGPVADSGIVGTATTIEGARELVPPEADACLERSPDDPPNVVETWI